jgi:hypothetical protein
VRFQISSVMDAIEQRLTTDLAGAQAVVDIGQVVRFVDLDGGRPVNLVRLGMVLDALSRYLVDEGVMLYGVCARELLSEAALTSKERMVLGRWTDEGMIEVTPDDGERAPELADLTGLPLITVADPPQETAARFGWLADGAGGRVLRLVARGGVAALVPADSAATDDDAAVRVIASAKVPTAELTEGQAAELPLPAEVLTGRAAARMSHTRVGRGRFMRAEPGPEAAELLARAWRCDGFDCPAFGDRRAVGQPVPRVRDGVPVCPRHDEPVVDIGPRQAAYPVSIIVDDLPRQRLVVHEGTPVLIGRDDDDPDVVSVGRWLHEAAAGWVSPVHLRLEARPEGLIITDLSENGTVIWQRRGPDDRGAARSLRRAAYELGEWDAVELYTGIALMRGDRRLATVLGRDEPASVLVDAPTAAHQQVSAD